MLNLVVYLYIIYRILFSVLNPVYAETSNSQEIDIYPVTGVQTFTGTPHLPNIVWYTNIPIYWKTGKVILSGKPDGTGFMDVGVQLEVYGSDQTKKFFYDGGCDEKIMPPLDITHLMGPKYKTSDPDGLSNIFIRYNKKTCTNYIKQDGVTKSYLDISPLYLVHFKEEEKPQAFLEMPFDYKTIGLSFEEAVLGASSFFDHEFPFLSSGLKEPAENNINKTLISFGENKQSKIPYSSHDGYDWARRSGVTLGTAVLAAASGTATAKWYGGCGQMIEINHHNGYQTRYCHLSVNNLVTKGAPVAVTAGQKIGEVGLTGNTTGAHIHFVVVEDKNRDLNFEDNIPDGVLDPLGFLSSDPDPWQTHVFTQSNQNKFGNRSAYLFNEKLTGGTYTIGPEGANITTGAGNIDIPGLMVSRDSILKTEILPPATTPKVLGEDGIFVSWGNRLKINMHDGFNNQILNFEKDFKLSMHINPAIKIPINFSTVAIYSSQDGVNWIKELSSTVDIEKKFVFANINHLTEFAVLGKLDQDLTPQEIAEWTGTWESHKAEPEIIITPIQTPTVVQIPASITAIQQIITPTSMPSAIPSIQPSNTQTVTPSITLTPVPTVFSTIEITSAVKKDNTFGEILGVKEKENDNFVNKKNVAQLSPLIIFLGLIVGLAIWIAYAIRRIK